MTSYNEKQRKNRQARKRQRFIDGIKEQAWEVFKPLSVIALIGVNSFSFLETGMNAHHFYKGDGEEAVLSENSFTVKATSVAFMAVAGGVEAGYAHMGNVAHNDGCLKYSPAAMVPDTLKGIYMFAAMPGAMAGGVVAKIQQSLAELKPGEQLPAGRCAKYSRAI